MFTYKTFIDASLGLNIFLLIIVGLFTNGPYALITTAVSADLGTHECLQGNSKAIATVSAIIDGCGSIGDDKCYVYQPPGACSGMRFGFDGAWLCVVVRVLCI